MPVPRVGSGSDGGGDGGPVVLVPGQGADAEGAAAALGGVVKVEDEVGVLFVVGEEAGLAGADQGVLGAEEEGAAAVEEVFAVAVEVGAGDFVGAADADVVGAVDAAAAPAPGDHQVVVVGVAEEV